MLILELFGVGGAVPLKIRNSECLQSRSLAGFKGLGV